MISTVRRELLLGSGVSHQKQLASMEHPDWTNLITLDINPSLKPDVVWDLNELPLPFEANTFDEVHAYHTIEHFGRQGDAKAFFDFFTEMHRILKPDGLFSGIIPAWNCEWAWGDPGHTRVITPGTLTFLSQKEYEKWVGKTVMCDYRFCYKADFERIFSQDSQDGLQYGFMLKAIK